MKENNNPKTGKKSRPMQDSDRYEPSYTEAQPVNITRFLVRIATVVAVVLALVFGMSIFFKVERVEIAGANKYTLHQIEDACGIRNGENLLTVNKAKVAGRLLKTLPYIESVRLGIRLPNTVIIEVKESEVAYAIEDSAKNWYLISAQGKVLEKISASAANGYTQIIGVLLDDPEIGEDAVAFETSAAGPNSETVPVTVYDRERLKTVLSIAKELEENGVLGAVSEINVSDMGGITMRYEQRYEVRLGDAGHIPKKIFSVVQAISQMSQYETGILDASFTTWPNDVWYGKGE